MTNYHPDSPPPSAVPQQQYQTMSSAVERQTLAARMPHIQFSLTVVQQPKQSRMSGIGEKNNRRPIDPPPAVSVYVNGNPITSAYIDTMQLLCFVQLVHADSLEPVIVPARERQINALVGVTNTTLHRICAPLDPARYPNGTSVQQGVFAFTDLSVRQEGYYKLQFHLFELVNGEAVPRCKKESDRFKVYAAKGFPGMEQSTVFTDILKKHGIRIRVSKSIRAAKNITTKQRSNINSNNHLPYDLGAIRDVRDQRHRRDPKFESYEPAPYHAPPSSGPILPPPNNTRPSPAPLTPVYERGFDHSREYGTFPSFPSHQNHQSMPSYGDRRDNSIPAYPERRHQEYNHNEYSHNRRLHEPAYNVMTTEPYSPPGAHYAYTGGTAITPSNPYVGASARRPGQKTFPPNPAGRPGDFNPGRRYSTTQTTSLPPLQQHINHDPTRDMYSNNNALQDASRRSTSNQRTDGQAYATETNWPPPEPVPLPSQQEWLYPNGALGYQGGSEGYRG